MVRWLITGIGEETTFSKCRGAIHLDGDASASATDSADKGTAVDSQALSGPSAAEHADDAEAIVGTRCAIYESGEFAFLDSQSHYPPAGRDVDTDAASREGHATNQCGCGDVLADLEQGFAASSLEDRRLCLVDLDIDLVLELDRKSLRGRVGSTAQGDAVTGYRLSEGEGQALERRGQSSGVAIVAVSRIDIELGLGAHGGSGQHDQELGKEELKHGLWNQEGMAIHHFWLVYGHDIHESRSDVG